MEVGAQVLNPAAAAEGPTRFLRTPDWRRNILESVGIQTLILHSVGSYNFDSFWISGLCPSAKGFGIWICFRPQLRRRSLILYWVPWKELAWITGASTLRLVLSKGPNRVGVFLPHLKTKQVQVPERCVSLYLEFRMMDKVQKPSNYVFKFY
jgi:hypothetical protein